MCDKLGFGGALHRSCIRLTASDIASQWYSAYAECYALRALILQANTIPLRTKWAISLSHKRQYHSELCEEYNLPINQNLLCLWSGLTRWAPTRFVLTLCAKLGFISVFKKLAFLCIGSSLACESRRPLRLDRLTLIIHSHFAINTAIIGL